MVSGGRKLEYGCVLQIIPDKNRMIMPNGDLIQLKPTPQCKKTVEIVDHYVGDQLVGTTSYEIIDCKLDLPKQTGEKDDYRWRPIDRFLPVWEAEEAFKKIRPPK